MTRRLFLLKDETTVIVANAVSSWAYKIILEKMDKSPQERVKECITIIRKLTENLALPEDAPEVAELRGRMNDYIRTGDAWSGTVDFKRWGRIAECNFPKRAGRSVEVTLKAISKQTT
jgi:hypothetical protein